MSGLRILQIAHDHPEWTPGGTEIVAHDLARALDARADVSARLLVAATRLQRPGSLAGSLETHGADFVLNTGAYDRFSMLRLDGDGWLTGLARVMETVRPHVVHLHGLDRLGAEIVPAIKRITPRARIVLTLHDYQLICANDGLLMTTGEGTRCKGAAPDRCRRCFPSQSAARHALRQAHLLALVDPVDLFLAPSAFLRERFIAWGLPPGRIVTLPNAVACTDAPMTEQEPARAQRNRFAFFGNVAQHKGALVLLDAAARLAREDSDIRVAVHGGLGWAEEPFRQAFAQALAAAAPVARHLGAYDRAEVLALMARTDWVVVPSLWWENAPLVIAEARAAGRPVICSGVGGMAELVAHRVNGLHVPPGDAEALAETMQQAAGDPALWSRLAGRAAPARHEDFVDRHIALFESLTNRVPA